MAENRSQRRQPKVTYGVNPGSVVITFPGGAEEPKIMWNQQDVLRFILELHEAYKKAWPGA